MKERYDPIRVLGLLLALTIAGLPVSSDAAIAGTGWYAASFRMPSQEAVPVQLPQAPMFRSAVTRVRVDAIVTDKDGNFIDDMGAEDFRVFEDGVEQEILNVQFVSLTSGQIRNVASRAAPVPSESGRSEPAEVQGPAAAPTEAVPIRRSPARLGAVVYLVDLPSLDRANKPRLAKTFEEFLEGEGDLDVPRSVYMIDQAAVVRELAPLTTDREVLRNAAEAVAAAKLTSTSIFSRMEREYQPLMQQAIDAQNSPTAGILRAADPTPIPVQEIVERLERKAQRDGEIERMRGERTLRTLLQFTNALSAMEGRTALVWISSGAMISEGGPYSAFAAAVREAVDAPIGTSTLARTAPDKRMLDLMEEVYETANTGNVSIYSVDPRPISALNNLGTSASIGQGLVSTALRRHVRSAYRDLTAPLVDVATKTGGRAFIGWGDLGRAFEEQYNDSTQFYLVFYEPPAPHEDGEYHEIEVQVTYPDAEVRARPGYRELPESELRTRKVAAALALPGSVIGRPVPASAFHRFAADGSAKILLVAGLPRPAETVTGSWAPAFGGVSPEEIPEEMIDVLGIPFFRVHAIALDRAGSISGETHELVQPRADLAEYAPDAAFRHFRYTTEWAVEPGTYDIRLLIAEDGGDRLGTSRLEVSVPASEGRWVMADPMLVAVDTEDGLRPLLDQALPAGIPIAASVQVSGATSPHVSASIFHRATRLMTAEVPAQALQAEGRGVHGGVLPLPYLDPDEYLVELHVVDTTVDGQSVRLLPLQVVEGN